MIKDTDVAYTAAFIDADGSIGLNVRRAAKGGLDYYVNVQIANTCIEVLEYIQGIFGGTIYNKGTNKSRGGKKDVYNLVIIGTKAGPLLEAILPYMKVKEDQCRLALDFLSEVDRCKGKYRLSIDDRAIRDDIAYTIGLVNRGAKAVN